MLERIREGSQGIVAKSVLGLVILTFAISGIGSYITSQADTAAAVVNDVEISASVFDQQYQNQRARMQQQYGDFVEQLMADEAYVERFRRNVLDSLVVEELQRQVSQSVGVRVGDDQVKQAILEMPEFQMAGTFDNEIYLAKLRQAGIKPNEFREMIRKDIQNSQYSNAVFGSEFLLPSEKKAFVKLAEQKRSFAEIELKVSDYESTVEVSEEDLTEYFEANKFQYKTEEKISVEYVLVDSAKMKQNIDVSEQEISTYYEQNISAFTSNARRKVAHILVDFGDDKSAASDKARDLKNQLNSGADFAELAKANSSDTFSAENGGDLGWLEPGLMGESFEGAVASLNEKGQVTDVVETDFGFHIIKLTDFEPEVVKLLADVEQEIKQTIIDNRITEKYITAQTDLVEKAFEIPDTLTDAAEFAGLKVLKTGLVSRSMLPAELANPVVSNKLFDETFRNERLNSDLLEISDSQSIVVRVDDYLAPQPKSFEDVKKEVELAVIKNKTKEMIEAKASELLAKLNDGESISQLGLPVRTHDSISRDEAEINAQTRAEVFKLPKPTDKPSVAKVVQRSGDISIVALQAVEEATVDNVEESDKLTQLESLASRVANKAYVDALKSNAEIKVNL